MAWRSTLALVARRRPERERTEMAPTTTLPGCWADFTNALNAGIDRVILHGVPGTGKTFGALTIGGPVATGHVEIPAAPSADHLGRRLICTDDMSSIDVTGAWVPSGAFTWLDGEATKAWRGDGTRGGRLVVDECDKASGDVLGLLLAMTDSTASCVYDHPEHGRIVPLPGFSAVMTSNIDDPDDLPEALRDRFPVAIRIDAAHPDALAKLPEHLREIAAQIVACEDPSRRKSLRAFYAFSTMLDGGMGIDDAGRLAFSAEWWAMCEDAMRVATVGA